MTFNTWNAGRNVNDGLRKVAKHIDAVAPDLVALQDMDSKASLKTLLSHLEHRYMGVTTKAGSPVAILTKYKYDPHLIAETKNGIGVRIDVDSWMYIHFWSVQLPFDNYGPHLLFNSTGSLSPQDDIIDREKGRLSVLKEILENQKMKRWLKASKFVSLIVAGDFGSPSHLDWNEENKELHRGLTVEWPVTKVMDDANFIDSYRNLHTDAKVSPGVTWSTIVKTNLTNPALSEPQDRIDFIFYQGRIIPKKSFTYAGSMVLESEPNHFFAQYSISIAAIVMNLLKRRGLLFLLSIQSLCHYSRITTIHRSDMQ
ncbi:hypothetical protein Q1695_004239 [Nippostrongylus brasiliensis]|nr:hypothetical protein Q1695_004239 [Nippostrongylus brasiliensis]